MSHNEIAVKETSTVIPQYLSNTYWWAYLHPTGVRLFERPWLVNLILFGNYHRLSRAAVDELRDSPGDTLQVACVYGSLSLRIARLQASLGHRLDVVDVAPIQLNNLQQKLEPDHEVGLHLFDSTRMGFDSDSYRNTLVFFLLHEQPALQRAQTLAEAIRVTRPGGKIVIVDYARPKRWSPLRYLLPLILRRLEPFAMDLWDQPVTAWLPGDAEIGQIETRRYFAGLYQKTIITLQGA
jgi:ubiquinone/menaquinone biosynthesis C-methylase UbiE